MKGEEINALIKVKALRLRETDKEKVKSMVESAKINVKIALSIPLTEESATVIFREIYESVRQLGDASWWLLGYEPLNHEISLEILKEADIKAKVKLNFLERFKKIRDDANYRGFRVTVSQAEEIIIFWKECAVEIITKIKL